MDILIKKSRMSSWKNKNKIGESFRQFKKKVKTRCPRMGWFRYAGRVEIQYVRRPFITCKEGQFDWWIKIQKMYANKEITEKKVLHWYYKQTKKIYHSSWFMVASQEITDQFIQNLKNNPNKVHNLTGEMKKLFKN